MHTVFRVNRAASGYAFLDTFCGCMLNSGRSRHLAYVVVENEEEEERNFGPLGLVIEHMLNAGSRTLINLLIRVVIVVLFRSAC